jgi:hypothetical protein
MSKTSLLHLFGYVLPETLDAQSCRGLEASTDVEGAREAENLS